MLHKAVSEALQQLRNVPHEREGRWRMGSIEQDNEVIVGAVEDGLEISGICPCRINRSSDERDR